ncbi:MAG TPA: biotin transporter BioY [Candidatus Limnocylindrales bacterium]|nr:biotin transporter BioY [Candidatus Limnocylindrales bacterium]
MQARATSMTLARVVLPERSRVADAALVAGGALFTALLAQISIPLPFTPVPITGQTLAVLLTGALLGSRLGPASMLLYVALGAIGLPFYAGGAHGLSQLLGPSGGYLAGFIVADFVIGWLAERRWDRSLPRSVGAMLVGQVVIYALGLLWLGYALHWPANLLALGMFPFLIGDALKLAIAGLLLPWGWRLRGER